MTRLGAVISEAVVHHYGRDELLRRLAHSFWFQSFGAVMGMDWHSSGITTSVIGALKRGLAPLEQELGFHVCGPSLLKQPTNCELNQKADLSRRQHICRFEADDQPQPHRVYRMISSGHSEGSSAREPD
jgi:hypothetical protein